MANSLKKRLTDLEAGQADANRCIVVCWPGGDTDAALAAKGLGTFPSDLVISLRKFDDDRAHEGWVSVNGVRV